MMRLSTEGHSFLPWIGDSQDKEPHKFIFLAFAMSSTCTPGSGTQQVPEGSRMHKRERQVTGLLIRKESMPGVTVKSLIINLLTRELL